MRLQISKHIHAALTGSTELRNAIGVNKVFPIATKNEVEFPFVVYQRQTVTPRYDKSGASVTEFAVNVYVLAESYTESIDIAEMVIRALERKNAIYKDFQVIDAIMQGASEDYTANTFVQTITFSFITKSL
jgi:hypothetical protein